MTDITVHESAAAMFRTTEGLGRWPYRGKVAAVGIGHSPTMRRWDGDPETSVGAWSVLAIRKAMADAGVEPDQVDGLVLDRSTTTGSFWPEGEPVPADFVARFNQTDAPIDGLAQLSPEWILKNVPELTNVKFVMVVTYCMSMALAAAIEAVGRGLTHTCIALKGWHNLAGRHHQDVANAPLTVSGPDKYGASLAGPHCFRVATQFQRYLHKYGKTHEMLAPFVVNSRRNGLLLPEGYWAQHRPTPLTVDDYNNAPWVAQPANLLDLDLPIHTAAAYLVTTAERANDMKQKPVYVLGHAGTASVNGDSYGPRKPRSLVQTLEEVEEYTAANGRKLFEATGLAATDIQFENMFDGYSFLHAFHIEGLGFAGIGRGEALDLYAQDISLSSARPVSPSGGNIGGGRTRFWGHTDSIQQIQGRAGQRQIRIPADIGVSGGPTPGLSNCIVWASSPN